MFIQFKVLPSIKNKPSNLKYPFFNAIVLIVNGNIFVHSAPVSGPPGTTEDAEDLQSLIVPTLTKFSFQRARQITSTISGIEFQTWIILILKKKCRMCFGRLFWGGLIWIGESTKASRKKGYSRYILKMSRS